MSRLLLLLALWFITLPIYSQDKNQSLKIKEELIELRIQQQQLDKKIDDQKALLEEKFALKQENLNYQKEEIGWKINTWINILGILVAFIGVVLPIIGFIYGRKVYADIKSQKAIIENEQHNLISWIEEKRKEFLAEQTTLQDWIRTKKGEIERSHNKFLHQLQKKHVQADIVLNELKEKKEMAVSQFANISPVYQNEDNQIDDGSNIKTNKIENTQFQEEMAIALSYFNTENYTKSIEHQNLILDKFKSDITLDLLADFYFRLAYSYSELNDHDNSIKYYELGLCFDDSNVVVWNNLGNQYFYKDEYDLAIEKYNKAISINSDYVDSWYNLGLVYHKIGKLDMAIEKYMNAIKINQNYARAYNNLGVVYDDKNDQSSAKDYYTKALTIDPNNEDALFNLGNVYLNQSDYQNAIIYYQRAIDVNPSNVLYWNSIGTAYNQNKEYGIAIEKLNEAIRINPSNDQTWFYLGFALSQTNNYEKAIASYSEAIRLNPNFIEAIGNLAELQIIKGQNPEELLLRLKSDASTTKEHFIYNFLDAIWQIRNRNNSRTKEELFGNFIDALNNTPSNLTWSFLDLKKWISKETSSTGLDDESRKLIGELIPMLEDWRDQNSNKESK